MQVEVGTVVVGKVTGLTNFGAFVSLPDGSTGMVHISEVANTYVKEIRDHLSENQEVKVKILGVSPEGKISLSIKQAEPPAAPAQHHGQHQQQGGSQRPGQRPQQRRQPNVWQGNKQTQSTGSDSFEDMMAKFKQVSDEKISTLKRSNDSRYSASPSRRGGGK